MPNSQALFHHFGLALKKEERALKFLEAMGYSIGESVYDPLQDVYVRMCTSSRMPSVETVMPGKNDGPLTPILKKTNEMIYHTCYEISSHETFLSDLNAQNISYSCLLESKPAILFGGRMVSFYYIIGYGVVELLES